MKARDIMMYPVVTVTPATPIRDAVRLMLERRISGLPVVDRAGNLVGIVTEADLLLKETAPRPSAPVVDWIGRWLWLERWLGAHRKAEGRTVGEVMTHNVIAAEEDATVHALASKMMRFQVNRIPIVRGRQLVGIVTRADILRLFLRSDLALLDEARRVVKQFALFGEELQVSVDHGVVILRGRVAAPGRRTLLLRRIEELDGVVAVDDEELQHSYPDTVASWE